MKIVNHFAWEANTTIVEFVHLAHLVVRHAQMDNHVSSVMMDSHCQMANVSQFVLMVLIKQMVNVIHAQMHASDAILLLTALNVNP